MLINSLGLKENLIKIFEKLKKEVVKTFLEESKIENFDPAKWGVNDIQQFQDHLLDRTKGSVSEKWFYTYFKNEPIKLPRIDMLNILSIYCGYNNWAEFKERQNSVAKKTKNKPKVLTLVISVIVGVALTFGLIWITNQENEFRFCFLDDNTNSAINTPIEIIILQTGESPYFLKTIDQGCFTWKTDKDQIIAIVKSPYHITDTIYRTIHSKGIENIKLKTDDYALMIHYYSTGNVKDWKKRRNHLSSIIDEKAIIYQVHPKGVGVELYSKSDFINKLTLPTSSLKNIDVIETKYSEGRISRLKFKLRDEEV